MNSLLAPAMYEADTCRKHVRPKIEAAGWDAHPHCYNEQITLTHERIIVAGNKTRRGEQKRADFLLRFTQDFTLAVVEAKKLSKPTGDGMQQATEYARRSSNAWKNVASHSMNWPRPRTSPTRTPSTYCVIWLLTPRFEHGANGPTTCTETGRTFLTGMRPRPKLP